MINTTIKKLQKLYLITSKHSNYQTLPKKLDSLIKLGDIKTKNMFEEERLNFIKSRINVKDISILDIGGNTGFFSFEVLSNGAKNVHYYEGNKAHADFVQLATKILNLEDQLIITNEYFTFDKEVDTNNKQYDTILLLNVLHHLGDDYGDHDLSLEEAKKDMITQLNSLASQADSLILQIGFNWMGNKHFRLFEKGTKQEVIDFVTQGVAEYWEVKHIGIAERKEGVTAYYDRDSENIKRMDYLGEFLNRPIFILESLK